MTRRALTILVVFVAAAAWGGCKSDPGPSRLTVSSSADASAPVVDQDYRFRLAPPGARWKVMGPDEAARITPDALAGATNGRGGVFGMVVAERMPGGTAEIYDQLLSQNLPAEEVEVEAREELDFHGFEAVRTTLTASTSGLRMRMRRLVFVNQGFAFQLLAWGPALTADAEDLEVFFSGFSVLPGEVKGRSEIQETPDGTGVDWRVEGGVYEGAAARLRARPPAGWRVSVGGELARMLPDADVGLISMVPEVYLAVLSEPLSGRDAAAIAADTAAYGRDLGEATGEAMAVETALSDGPLTLTRYDSAEPAPMAWWYGNLVRDERLYRVIAWHYASLAAEARERIPRAVASLEPMTDQEIAALDAALAAAPDPQNQVEGSATLRRGTWRDYAHGVRWRRPDAGRWRILIGEAARALDPDAAVHYGETSAGISGVLLVEETGEASADALLSEVVARVSASGFVEEARGDATLDGVAGRWASGTLRAEGIALDYRITAALRGDVGVHAHTYGLAGVASRHRALFEGAAAGIGFFDDEALERDGHRYLDRRMGYQLSLPGGDGEWSVVSLTPKPFEPVGSFTRLTRGDAAIMMFALCFLEQGQDEAFYLDFVEQAARDAFGAIAGGEPRRRTSTIAGEEARQLSWEGRGKALDAWILFRDRTLYVLMALRDDDDVAFAGQARRALKLLD